MSSLLWVCLLLHICLLWNHIGSVSANVCDSATFQPGVLTPGSTYLKNHLLEKGIVEMRAVNASQLGSCVKMCCDKVNCNFAYLKDSHECFLVACQTDHACKPVPNRGKREIDPVDHLVRVRSVVDSKNLIKALVSKEQKELLKLEDTLAPTEKNPDCVPTVLLENNSPCPINEVCVKKTSTSATSSSPFECLCPQEEGLHRIEGVCREFLPNTDGCMMFLNECDKTGNEECVALHARSKHGTCQCRIGFRREMDSLKCVPDSKDLLEETKTTSLPRNSRRRPSPPVSIEEAEAVDNNKRREENSGSLWNRILEELGVGDAKPKTATARVLDALRSSSSSSSSSTSSPPSTSPSSLLTTSTTTATTSTSTSTTATVITDPPNINTKNLIAEAGPDQHIFYPSKVGVLNGNRTLFRPITQADRITRWMWVKSDDSPAFGQFVGSNEGPVVMYEQLVEGVYKFTLRVWSSNREYSQSTTHVYVHSTLNSNRSVSAADKAAMRTGERRRELKLNDNIIQVELDIEPSMLSESLRERFLFKFQLMLEQHRTKFGLVKPRVVLLNTRIVSPLDYSHKSTVVLELIVTDVVAAGGASDGIDWEVPGVIANGIVVNDDVDLVGDNRRIVDNSNLIRHMRRHQNFMRFSFDKIDINSVWAYFGGKPSSGSNVSASQRSMLDSLDIKVLAVSKLTCTSDYYASAAPHDNSYNCSNHGKCDFYSHKCICNRFWMPNLYLRYFDYESDLTNGNNCEYNIPLVVVLSILAVFTVLVIINILFKYFFYYIFCCCLCKRAGKRVRNNRLGKKLNQDDSYLDDDELNTSERSDRAALIKTKVKNLKKPFDKMLNGGGAGYSLLKQEDNDTITWRGGKPNGPMVTNLNYADDDEDVIYEENSVSKSRGQTSAAGKNKPRDENIKKYSVI